MARKTSVSKPPVSIGDEVVDSNKPWTYRLNDRVVTKAEYDAAMEEHRLWEEEVERKLRAELGLPPEKKSTRKRTK
jgi:hypothetical protein